MRRFIIVVLDSLGVGALPDAAAYSSLGTNTFGHIAESAPMNIPNLQRLGIGNVLPLANVPPAEAPAAAWGKMAALSAGMDTTCGHWEICGIILDKPFPVFPHGFPLEIIEPFCEAIGTDILGNIPASGVEIIQRLGVNHMATGRPIVYTSADSTFQIAAHESVIPVERLYEICRIARKMLRGPYNVGRVIARPFIGSAEDGFTRTENRRDFSVQPPAGGLMEHCYRSYVPVISVGKIYDIFAGQYIDKAYEGHNNKQSEESLLQALEEQEEGFIFANFVDFDTLYGHRNDVDGYRRAIEEFDLWLPDLTAKIGKEDILVICADHGNDPTSPTYDHSREYVPLLVYGPQVRPHHLGIRASFADLGQTAAEYLRTAPLAAGVSFLPDLF